jgi:hypothetical protein
MRLRLLLPFCFLALAALACDDVTYYDTRYVSSVAADAERPGYVHVQVAEMVGWYGETLVTETAYESQDYGASWQPVEAAPKTAEPAYSLRWSGEQLMLDGAFVWAFPRAGFRDFFYDTANIGDDSSTIDYFVPNMGDAANAVSGDTLYVSAGTEGLLVGPAPNSGSNRAWELRQNIPVLRPLPMGFSNPLTLAGVILAALLIPPLPLLHAFLLSRIWRYLMPARLAWRRALRLSLAFAGLAAAGILLWLLPFGLALDHWQLALAIGSIVVAVSVWRTVQYARAAGMNTRLAGGMALLFASVVPAGALAVWGLWWAVGIIVIGGGGMGWLAERQLRANGLIADPPTARATWQVDRMALEGFFISAIVIISAMIASGFVRAFIDYRTQDAMLLPLIIAGGILLCVVINVRFATRIKTLTASSAEVGTRPTRISTTLVGVVMAAGGTALFAVAVFIGQMGAASWFSNLMSP